MTATIFTPPFALALLYVAPVLGGNSTSCDLPLINYDYPEIQGSIGIVELIIFAASIISTRKHMDAHAGKISLATLFHVVHAAFCLLYGVFHLILWGGTSGWTDRPICECDPVNIMAPLYISCYTIMWGVFISYWRKAVRRAGHKDERVRVRAAVYVAALAVVVPVWSYAILSRPCKKENFHRFLGQDMGYFNIFGSSILVLDSGLLGWSCFLRWREYMRASSLVYARAFFSRATAHTAAFVSLPVSLLAAPMIDYLTEAVGFKGTLSMFIWFLYPSIIMLYLMWRRHYIMIIGTGRTDLDDELFFGNPFESPYHPSLRSGSELGVPLLTGGAGALDTPSVHQRVTFAQGAFEDGIASDMHRELQPSTRIEAIHALNFDAGGDDPIYGKGSTFSVRESLETCPCALDVAQHFLSSVVLRPFENAYATHCENSELLLNLLQQKAQTGQAASLFGNLEQQSQYEEIETGVKDLTRKYAEFVIILRVVSTNLSSRAKQRREFKRSADKKSKILAHLATNIQLHSALIYLQTDDKVEAAVSFNSVTFGAPSAHSLGFKFGGLKEVFSALEKDVGYVGDRNPPEALRQLELRFMARARESIVLSQALVGIVAAATQQLSNCLAEREEDKISQYAKIGLLVHSVCLLSTHGNEAHMISDFQSAYEKLNVTIRFVSRGGDSWHGEAFQVESVLRDGDSDEKHRTFSSMAEGGGIGSVTVTISVGPLADFEWIARYLGIETSIRVIPLLFNLGVNEMQSVANKTGSTSLQNDLNRHNLRLFKAYVITLNAITSADSEHGAADIESSSSLKDKTKTLRDLLTQLEDLIEDEAQRKSKNVDLLLTSCALARLVHAARTTSCKSAKDRTSVFDTLEMADLAMRRDLLLDSEKQRVLDELRGLKGVRLQNCQVSA